MTPTEKLSTMKKVYKMLEEQISPLNTSPRVYLDRDEYQKFIEEVEPLYKEQYGSFIIHEGALKDGYENVLFNGCAVCLKQ